MTHEEKAESAILFQDELDFFWNTSEYYRDSLPEDGLLIAYIVREDLRLAKYFGMDRVQTHKASVTEL